MKVKIELRRFRAVSLARAGKNEVRRLSLQGIWLDFAKNRIMTTDSHMMMITLPGYGMEIESAPTEHTYLNIPAYAVKQILKIADIVNVIYFSYKAAMPQTVWIIRQGKPTPYEK